MRCSARYNIAAYALFALNVLWLWSVSEQLHLESQGEPRSANGYDSIGCALHVQMTMLNNGMIRVMCVKYVVALLMALKAKVPGYFQKLAQFSISEQIVNVFCDRFKCYPVWKKGGFQNLLICSIESNYSGLRCDQSQCTIEGAYVAIIPTLRHRCGTTDRLATIRFASSSSPVSCEDYLGVTVIASKSDVALLIRTNAEGLFMYKTFFTIYAAYKGCKQKKIGGDQRKWKGDVTAALCSSI